MSQPDEQRADFDPVALLEWVDEVADRFEAAWEGGLRPQITDYLDEAGGPRRAALMRELALIDLERRHKARVACPWEEHLRQFPELREPQGAAADLLAAVRSAPPLS